MDRARRWLLRYLGMFDPSGSGPMLLVLPLLVVTVATATGVWWLFRWGLAEVTPTQGPDEVRTTAEIVAVESEYSGTTGGSVPMPVYNYPMTVRFETLGGREIEAESRCYDGIERNVGDQVEVFYSRANPTEVCVAGTRDRDKLNSFAAVMAFWGSLAGFLVAWLTAHELVLAVRAARGHRHQERLWWISRLRDRLDSRAVRDR